MSSVVSLPLKCAARNFSFESFVVMFGLFLEIPVDSVVTDCLSIKRLIRLLVVSTVSVSGNIIFDPDIDSPAKSDADLLINSQVGSSVASLIDFVGSG